MSRTDTAYDRIAEAIGDFVLPPGHPLSENELSDWLGVSRTPIRSALARLAADGLVEISPGRPARVSAISLDTVVSIYQLRQAVEVYAARLSCLADDRSEFDELATAYRAAASDPKNFDVVSAELGERYRLALRECSGNGPLCDVIDRTRVQLARVRHMLARNERRAAASAAQSAEICAAIVDRDDVAAASAVSRKVQDSLVEAARALTDRLLDPPATPPVLGRTDSASR